MIFVRIIKYTEDFQLKIRTDNVQWPHLSTWFAVVFVFCVCINVVGQVTNEFCHLLEKSKQLFNGLRDLPQVGGGKRHQLKPRVFNTCTKSHHNIKQGIKCNKRMCSSARSQAVAGLLWSHVWHLHSTLEVPTATPSSAWQVETCYKKISYKRTKEDAYCKSSLWSGNGMSAMNKNIIDRWKCQNHSFLKLSQKFLRQR